MKREVITKYEKTLKEVAKLNDCDLTVAYAMVKEMAIKKEYRKYPGVRMGFDWEGFLKDIKE